MVIQSTIPELALWQRLSRFGLNPGDWVVRRLCSPIGRRVFYAINRSEPTWVLIGEAKTLKRSWDWQTLELCEVD